MKRPAAAAEALLDLGRLARR